MNIIRFPSKRRDRLPDDAIPKGKDRHATVFPMNGAWAVMEMDEGGGSLVSGLTKHQAILSAVELVETYCGTMEVVNRAPDDLHREVPA